MKNVLITGASSGFGKLIAQTLLQNAYTVFATMRGLKGKNANKAKELKEFAEKHDGTIHLLELDVSNEQSVNKAVRKALDLESHIDVVINNAGVGVGGFAEATTMDQFEKMFDVNVHGVQRVNRAVLPHMRKRGSGLLIHISTIMGRIVLPFSAAYTASKYALEGMAETYRYELAPTGVDVAVVEPGGFPTNFFDNMEDAADEERLASYGELGKMPEQMWSNMSKMLQSDEAPDPQAVADAVLDLIETPVGQRPFRTVVDPMMGGEAPETVNKTGEEIQKQLLRSMGMENLLSVKS